MKERESDPNYERNETQLFFPGGFLFWVIDFCFASSTNLRKKANFSQLITSNARWVQNLVEKKVTTKQLALARGFRLKLELTDTT